MSAARPTTYRLLFDYAKPFRAGWIVIGLATLASLLLALLGPWPMKVLVDHVLGPTPPSGLLARVPNSQSVRALLVYVVAAQVVLFIVASLADVVRARASLKVGRRMVYNLAGDLFAAIQRRSL